MFFKFKSGTSILKGNFECVESCEDGGNNFVIFRFPDLSAKKAIFASDIKIFLT